MKSYCKITIRFLLFATLFALPFFSDAQKSISLKISNDMTYFTDRYFSNGIELSISNPIFQKSPFNFLLLPHNDNDRTHWSLTFTHHIYTPTDTYTPEINYEDHPYSSYFLFGLKKESYNYSAQIKKTSEIRMGWIGPMAGGGVFQNSMHANISIAEHVEGWQYQVANDLCIQYNMMVEKGIIRKKRFENHVYLGAKFGSPHTEAQLGTRVRTGIFENYFRDKEIFNGQDFQIWIYCSADALFVYYNATLQGGLINLNSPNTFDEISPLLWHFSFGGALQYKFLKLELAQEVISPQFNGMGWHRWAYLELSARL